MTTTVQDVVTAANSLWPETNAESWDRVGLVAGVLSEPVTRVALALDASSANADAAIASNCQLLFTHHPLLLKGVHSIAANTYKGAILTKLLRSGVSLYAAHTNADTPRNGVSDVIARKLGLVEITPLIVGEDADSGLGRIGKLPRPQTLAEFAQHAAQIFPRTVSGLRVGGDPERIVRTVALLGGAGDSLLTNPVLRQADVYVTSDLRHHPAQEFLEDPKNPALIDVAHWAAESLWLETAASQLAEALPEVEFMVVDVKSDPWCFTVGAESEK